MRRVEIMANKKPFGFWAKWMSNVWLVSFSLIILSLIIVLGVFQSGGLKGGQVLNAVTEIWKIYTPFLGMILVFSSSGTTKKNWRNKTINVNLLMTAFVICILFNLIMLIWTFRFLINLYANIEDYIEQINFIAAIMAVFLGSSLGYFYKKGFNND